MLESNSINGMAKVRCEQRDRTNDPANPNGKLCDATFSYTDKNNTPRFILKKKCPMKDIWYRDFSAVGNSASKAVLGGKRKTKRVTKKKSRRQ